MFWKLLVVVGFLVDTLLSSAGVLAAELLVGTAVADITPTEPVAVSGQFHLRIAKTVETPITASVIALESREGGVSHDVAIMVSCDLLYIPSEVLELVRNAVRERLADLDTTKLFLNGTHTHTAPALLLDKYPIPKEGVIQVERYRSLLTERVADAIVQAWHRRSAASVTWGLSHAVVAYNRRAVYTDGSARMYGRTDTAEFRNLEGYEDHDVNTLFFWNDSSELVGVIVNVSCPAQEVESRSVVNADSRRLRVCSRIRRAGSPRPVIQWCGGTRGRVWPGGRRRRPAAGSRPSPRSLLTFGRILPDHSPDRRSFLKRGLLRKGSQAGSSRSKGIDMSPGTNSRNSSWSIAASNSPTIT